eukprot:CAMPEP_0116151382 /NCGR_PEP_ID=MMETSP0329-20121206/20065_1 /TAXON_ID=697910 /ORGANISM="Pseudo-nitzschia arenysensis, Strain B593" /LENGTH=484 /DNA_ID=CAMNT_0003647987 /DNA_START=114 /DNA_END=1568 /DNA_ORIENTATION=+
MAPKSLNFSSEFSKYVPEDKDQLIVETPYGKGIVVRTRKNDDGERKSTSMYEIQMVELAKLSLENREEVTPSNLSNIKMLYTPIKYPSISPVVGSNVITKWGRGKVIEIRDDDMKTHVVQLSSWRLANRSSVFCYVCAEECEVVKPRKLYDMDVFQKVEYANELKQSATIKFKEKDYHGALELFARAIDAVRYVQHGKDSTNELRADLISVMITCSNNASLCSSKKDDWARAAKFGENALVLIEALESRGNESKIKAVMNSDGIDDSQLFGTWKVKSLLLIAKSQMEEHQTAKMTNNLKKALKAISTYKNENDKMYKQLLAQEKDIRRLRLEYSKKSKAALIKEKLRARAMFGDKKEKKHPQRVEESKIDNTTDISKQASSITGSSSNPHASLESLSIPNLATNEVPSQIPDGAPASEPKAIDVKSIRKNVTFKEEEEHCDDDDDGDDSSNQTFFEEHIEALLILTGIAVGCFVFKLITNKKKL